MAKFSDCRQFRSYGILSPVAEHAQPHSSDATNSCQKVFWRFLRWLRVGRLSSVTSSMNRAIRNANPQMESANKRINQESSQSCTQNQNGFRQLPELQQQPDRQQQDDNFWNLWRPSLFKDGPTAKHKAGSGNGTHRSGGHAIDKSDNARTLAMFFEIRCGNDGNIECSAAAENATDSHPDANSIPATAFVEWEWLRS